MKHIPDGSVDMILTDPPYGTTACKWDSIIPLEPMWEQLKRIIKPNGAIVMTASQPFTTTLIASNIKMFRYEWIWDKTRGANFLNANCQPMKSHENIVVFSKLPCSPNKKGTSFYNPIKEGDQEYISKLSKRSDTNNTGGKVKGVETKLKGKHPKSIITAVKDGKAHPTQKPVALMEYLIKTYTNDGETVLDFTMGSGTTGVACKNLSRDFIGIELDKQYYDIAVNRINQ
ncbi:MAG: DNA-methyltransferase [Bacteroidota bacterium]